MKAKLDIYVKTKFITFTVSKVIDVKEELYLSGQEVLTEVSWLDNEKINLQLKMMTYKPEENMLVLSCTEEVKNFPEEKEDFLGRIKDFKQVGWETDLDDMEIESRISKYHQENLAKKGEKKRIEKANKIAFIIGGMLFLVLIYSSIQEWTSTTGVIITMAILTSLFLCWVVGPELIFFKSRQRKLSKAGK